MSGIDTTEIDKFRQGHEAVGRRVGGMLPLLEPELTSSVLVQVNFGQTKTFPDNTPFDDLEKFNAVVFLDTDSAWRSYPAIIANVNIPDPSQMDGVLEPLTIRAAIGLTSIDHPYEAHTTRGALTTGNEDHFGKVNVVSSIYDVGDRSTVSPFIDAGDRMGSVTGAISLVGVYPDDERRIKPFDETFNPKFVLHGTTMSGSSDVQNAVMAMTGSATDEYMPSTFKSLGTGFTYPGSSLGVDSVAFGGF